jgi:hypothetical protein
VPTREAIWIIRNSSVIFHIAKPQNIYRTSAFVHDKFCLTLGLMQDDPFNEVGLRIAKTR